MSRVKIGVLFLSLAAVMGFCGAVPAQGSQDGIVKEFIPFARFDSYRRPDSMESGDRVGRGRFFGNLAVRRIHNGGYRRCEDRAPFGL